MQKRKVRENCSSFKHNSIENLSFIRSISSLMTCGFFILDLSRIGLTFHKVGKWITCSFNSTLILKGMWITCAWCEHSSQWKLAVSESSRGQNCLVLFQERATFPQSCNLKRLALDLCPDHSILYILCLVLYDSKKGVKTLLVILRRYLTVQFKGVFTGTWQKLSLERHRK